MAAAFSWMCFRPRQPDLLPLFIPRFIDYFIFFTNFFITVSLLSWLLSRKLRCGTANELSCRRTRDVREGLREEPNMIRIRKVMMAATFSAVASAKLWAQAPRLATLDIDWENGVVYIDDVADPARFVTSATPTTPNVRNFMTFMAIGDLVSVNGKPVKGAFVDRGRVVQLIRTPVPGQAISDVALRGGMVEIHLEILHSDGTPIGTIMTSGYTGGAPLAGSPGPCCNLTVTGGTGAYLGVRGTLGGNLSPGFRATSMTEDPANRRINGGNRGRWSVYLIPLAWPEIMASASGPAVFHADFSPVTTSRPARAGETLIMIATGLGPTRPGVPPGTPFPENPLQEVNSPVEVTVNGNQAEVLNKVGWPGRTDTYRLDILVPNGTATGMATIQLTAAFIRGGEIKVPVQ
jgi:hypothetical protein